MWEAIAKLAGTAPKAVHGLFSRMLLFFSEYKVLTIGVFATIFTWGLIQELRRTVLSPVIRRHFVPNKKLEIDERQLTRVKPGEFVVALIEWALLMTALFLISIGVDILSGKNFVTDVGQLAESAK